MDKKELLIQAWKEVFDVDEVAEDADFFEEGGDSIKAVQLSSWLMERGVKLDLAQIFNKPVLSQMAEILEDTKPVQIPKELMTKEGLEKKFQEYMAGQASLEGQKPQSAPEQPGETQWMGYTQAMPQPVGSMPVQTGAASEFNMMMSMFQTILAQQQVMLQMLQMTIARTMAPAPLFPAAGFPGAIPQARPVTAAEQPAAKPGADGAKKAQESAEAVLDGALSGLLNKKYSKTEDLFEQGLTSLDTVKLVTMCGENGYTLTMQDIYMHSTFEELVACMKPGK